jgi:hypothetical protein
MRGDAVTQIAKKLNGTRSIRLYSSLPALVVSTSDGRGPQEQEGEAPF